MLRHPSLIIGFAALVCLTASVAAADPAPPDPTPPDPPPDGAPIGPEIVPRPIAFSISGGVSLGAYEAGATWGLVRYLRAVGDDRTLRPDPNDGRADLVGITGASAGAINTFVSALMWCRSAESAGAIDDNLLRTTWLPVGFDGFLPPDTGTWRDRFLPLDGLLTRTASAEGLRALQAAVGGGGFRPHCRVPLAFSVTRGTPWQTDVDGLTVPNQRFAVPLELVVDAAGYPWFVNHRAVVRNASQLGQYLFLAERPGEEERARRGYADGQPPPYVVPADLVMQAALASSAFPLAFSPVSLVTCPPRDQCPAEQPPAPLKGSGWLECGERPGCDDFSDLTCAGLVDPGQTRAPCASRFVDGGFFDNVPLGMAMAQTELSTPDIPLRRPVDYLYFSPGIRRHAQAAEQSDDLGDRGLARVLDIFGHATATAVSYELFTVLRFNHFNRPVGWYAGRIGELIERMAASRTPTGDPAALLGPALDACLAALPPADSGCGELPPSCLALTRSPPPLDLLPPTARPAHAACLPADPAAVGAALTRLGRRLNCRAQAAVYHRSVVDQHPPIMDHVVAFAARSEACLVRADGGAESLLTAALARDTALAREAVDALRRSAAPDRTLLLPSRFAEVAAGQLQNFGGFFDRPMRRHDYAVGIYESMVNIATWQCRHRSVFTPEPLDEAALGACVAEHLPPIRGVLGVDRAPTIAAIVDALTALEAGVRAQALGQPTPTGDPRATCPADDPSPCAVQRALLACAPGDGRRRVEFPTGTVCLGPSGIEPFVEALRAEGYRPESTYMTRLFDDRQWAAALLERLTRRLAAIEKSESSRARRRATFDPGSAAEHRAASAFSDTARLTFSAAGSALRAIAPGDPGVDLDPSTIPDDVGFTAARLLPYRVGVEVLQGGVAIGWEPRFGLREAHARLTLDPVVWQGRGRGGASRAGLLLGLRPWDSVVFGALSLGGRLDRPWDGDAAWTLSAVAGLDLIADRLRVEVGYPALDFGGAAPDRADIPLSASLWLLDLPGLAWLLTL